ncbi:MAG: DMT family protein [Candidatus Obscuribacter sp.]|nr:DMT family protein [Candidatus Obscuribacter sp.]
MQGIWTIALLAVSNIFMTFAWYGHLKFKSSPLWIAIGVSWLIALLEYCFQVPANRFGSAYFSTAQLKVMQEVITLLVFGAFSVLYLKEQFRWNYLVAFVLIVGAVFFVFAGGNDKVNNHASVEVPASVTVAHSGVSAKAGVE